MGNKVKRLSVSRLSILGLIMVFLAVTLLAGCGTQQEAAPAELTKPELTGGMRGEMGIDKNINESTIDNYLGRDDAVYRDMRMLEDPAQYENIGGDRFLSGYVEGFEVVPLPYIIPVEDLPRVVGETYTGKTLFAYNDDYIMSPAYEESIQILEELFPKDKVIFLMCGGGGYAGMMKDFLISMGWDPEKIYNVGGYWYYQGEHNVEVKKEENGQVTYDFDSVPYHEIDFDSLTPAKETYPPYISTTGVVMSGDKIELEQDSTFKLKAIVQPAEAWEQSTEWSSSDPKVAYVDSMGTIRGLKPGTTTITAKTTDGGFTDTCEVTVTERTVSEHVELDDLKEESDTFNSNDPGEIMMGMSKFDNDMERAVREGYYTYDGEGYTPTDLWTKEFNKMEEKSKEAIKLRTEILHKLIEEKKNFILIIYTKNCEGREYQSAESAVEILKEKGIPYFYTNDMASGYDTSLYESGINYDGTAGAAAVIFKDGEIFATLDPDAYSIKSDEELISWFSRFIDIE